MAAIDLGTYFDGNTAVAPPPATNPGIDLGAFFDKISDAARAAMDAPVIPPQVADVLKLPNAPLGKVAEGTMSTLALPGHLLAAPVEKAEESLGIQDMPVFPFPGTSPIPLTSGKES